jgi:hypothetical protein
MKAFYFVIIFWLFLPFVNSACDCDGEEVSIEEGIKRSEKVFIGTVLSFQNELENKDGRKYFITEFKIKEAFKEGQKHHIIKVISEATDCGGYFQKGQSYLIFTFKNEEFDMPEYHQCFKLALAEDKAEEEISVLRTISNE